MSLGEKIKSLRQEKGYSQPELAEKVGIEQSYLSKLENDKSIPSNDIFRQILTALNVELSEFLAMFSKEQLNSTLKQIPDIEHFINQKSQVNYENCRQFLTVSSALIVLAVTLFYTGFSKELFSERFFRYHSDGVVLAGEPNNIFNNWSDFIAEQGKDRVEAHRTKKLEMAKREDGHYLYLPENVGRQFVKEGKGGTRFYELNGETQKKRSINAVLQMLGVLLFSAGVMGFLLERRLFK